MEDLQLCSTAVLSCGCGVLTADCCRQMPQFSYCWACQFEQPTTRDMMAASLKKDSQVMVLPVTLRSTDVPAAGNQWQ